MLIKRKSIEAQANTMKGPRKTTTGPAMAEEKPLRTRRVKFAPINLSEHNGVRYLHFGSEWVQGAMRVARPDQVELTYVQQMLAPLLFQTQPQHIVQLGLGSAALTKFCYRYLPETRVTAIELNPEVIAVCHSMFKLPQNDARLQVIQMDAADYVEDVANHASCDILQVDLYDAAARGPVLDSQEFYRACAACLTPHGVLSVNLFGEHPSYKKNLQALRAVFPLVLSLPAVAEGNVVVVAFKKRQALDFAAITARASQLQSQTKLPAKSWLPDLQACNATNTSEN